ncbi:MAG: type I secretion system permease/ATPase [Pseudomonadota bacterium]
MNSNPLADAFKSLRSTLWSVGLVSAVTNLLMLTGPIFMLQIYDRVLASRSVPTLLVLTGLVIALYTFMGLFEVIRARMLHRAGEKIDADVNKAAVGVSLDLPRAQPAQQGRIVPVRDLDQIRQFFAGMGPIAVFDLPWLPLYLGVVFLFHPWLGWLASAGALVLLLITLMGEWVLKKPLEQSAGLAAQRDHVLKEGESASQTLYALGMQKRYADRWSDRHGSLLGIQRNVGDHTTVVRSTTKVFRLFLQSAVLALGAYLVILQEITPGVMIAASIISARALAPMEQAIGQWRPFLGARQAFRRLNAFLDAVAKVDEERVPLPAPKQSLTVAQLAIAAPGGQTPLVRHADFGIDAGEVLGVIGPSGSGKSTLGRALVGIWPPVRGSVRLDGAELDQWDAETRGAFVGYLPQDVDLFSGSVAENIARFEADMDMDAVIDAARIAGIHDFVLSLPDGYNTMLGVDAVQLSAGQTQRVGLARAVYGDPFLVVLDEPNANLDSQGDQALNNAIEQLKQRGTVCVIIAHRPSAILHADKVVVMSNGAQASFGPKDEVLKGNVVPIGGAA